MADAPIFAQQTLTFVWTLLDLAGVPPDQIVVHALTGSDPSVRRRIDALGVRTVDCHPFDPAHPHCNKLRQLEDPGLARANPLVLCDTDLAFAAPIGDRFPTAGVTAKPVDFANPSLEVWRAILAAAGFSTNPALTETTFGDALTPMMNCNGGLYLLAPDATGGLREVWPRWARWLIDRPSLLPGPVRVHLDQVAFGLAVTELQLPIEALPIEYNYPTHKPSVELPDVAPRVLHYHTRVDPSGFPLPVSRPHVDRAIASVHDVIRHRRRESFENRSFWDFRYRQAPELGSGLGSRGAALETKRALLSQLITSSDTVLDVGCGDLEVSRGLTVAGGTGVDISYEAIATARTKRPDWHFHPGELRDAPVSPHDVVIAFDVLIHQRTLASYRSLTAQLLRLATRTLIVSGYNQPPWHSSEITFFHEPLTTTLGRLAGFDRVALIGGYRDTTVVRVDLTGVAPSDALIGRLLAMQLSTTPHGRLASLAGDLISTQFAMFGGHTRNELAMVLSMLRPGDTVLDIGAHIGSFTVPMARLVGAHGLVVAVEPDALNLEVLYENVAGNDVADHVIVVSAVAGEPATPLRAVADAANTGASHFVPDPATPGARRARGVDDLTREHALARRVRLLKIDVEGMELSVLRSADETIATSRPLIYCEISAEQLARQRVTVADLDRFFAERRYALYRNIGDRNSAHDEFTIARLPTLEAGGAFFDVLAVPVEHVADLSDQGRLPPNERGAPSAPTSATRVS